MAYIILQNKSYNDEDLLCNQRGSEMLATRHVGEQLEDEGEKKD